MPIDTQSEKDIEERRGEIDRPSSTDTPQPASKPGGTRRAKRRPEGDGGLEPDAVTPYDEIWFRRRPVRS